MSSSDTTIDQLLWKRPSKTKDVPLKSSYPNINRWSYKRPKTVPVLDFFFNMGDVTWKGVTHRLELDLHKAMIRDEMRKTGKTYTQVMDEAWEMLSFM